MDETTLLERLTHFCARKLSEGSKPTRLVQLTGGASQQTWAFHCAERELILRRSDGQDSVAKTQGLLNARQEAALIEAMSNAGVRVPEICGELADSDGLGDGFVMSRVPGEALPQKLFRQAEYAPALEVFVNECAKQLAIIHSSDVSPVEAVIPTRTPRERVADLISRYDALGSSQPVLSLALRWLKDNAPDVAHLSVVHGDFRMGNLLLGNDRINAVLDWELAHIGDPVFDLAYLCAPCWRFGRYEKPVGGVGQIEDLLTAYERYSKLGIDRERFQFWLVFASAWWAITCAVMFSAWRSGEVRTLERVVIGTRVTENDVDLLLLLAEVGGFEPVVPLDWPGDQAPTPSGVSRSSEIAIALEEWVTQDLVPGMSGSSLFEARVARNALGILARREGLGRVFEARAAERYAALGLSPDSLARQLFDDPSISKSRDLSRHLQLCAIETLLVDQPRYAGLKAARAEWS